MAMLKLGDLNPREVAAFTLYKSNGPFDTAQTFTDALNTALATATPLTAPWLDEKAVLDGIFARSTVSNPTRVYRATLDAYVAPHLTGSVLTYPAYMSTTAEESALDRHFSTPFRKLVAALLVIDCGVGTMAIDGEMISDFGGMEQEILLAAGTKFTLVKVETFDTQAQMVERMSPYYAPLYSGLNVYHFRTP